MALGKDLKRKLGLCVRDCFGMTDIVLDLFIVVYIRKISTMIDIPEEWLCSSEIFARQAAHLCNEEAQIHGL